MGDRVRNENQAAVNAFSADQLAGKYLTFFLGEEQYGLEILKVREINGMMSITSLPTTPDYVDGVINLRGKVIPVMDLRAKFGLQRKEVDDETCIIVVEMGEMEVGVVVDKVSEVQDINAADIEPPPTLGEGLETDYILGMGKSADRVTILLNLDKVFSTSEVQTFQRMADSEAA